MPTPLDQLLDLLRRIESGSIPLMPDEDPRAAYCGDVTYRTADGWQIVVFNDCDSWDYIDHAITPDGQRVDWGPKPEECWLMWWRPNPATVERIWGLP